MAGRQVTNFLKSQKSHHDRGWLLDQVNKFNITRGHRVSRPQQVIKSDLSKWNHIWCSLTVKNLVSKAGKMYQGTSQFVKCHLNVSHTVFHIRLFKKVISFQALDAYFCPKYCKNRLKSSKFRSFFKFETTNGLEFFDRAIICLTHGALGPGVYHTFRLFS